MELSERTFLLSIVLDREKRLKNFVRLRREHTTTLHEERDFHVAATETAAEESSQLVGFGWETTEIWGRSAGNLRW